MCLVQFLLCVAQLVCHVFFFFFFFFFFGWLCLPFHDVVNAGSCQCGACAAMRVPKKVFASLMQSGLDALYDEDSDSDLTRSEPRASVPGLGGPILKKSES